MPPSSTATLRSSYPAAISSRAARALVRSSTHAQYRMITRSGGSEAVAACPWAASIVASGSERAPAAWALSNSRPSRVSTNTPRPAATSTCACVAVRPDTAGPSSGVASPESCANGGVMVVGKGARSLPGSTGTFPKYHSLLNYQPLGGAHAGERNRVATGGDRGHRFGGGGGPGSRRQGAGDRPVPAAHRRPERAAVLRHVPVGPLAPARVAAGECWIRPDHRPRGRPRLAGRHHRRRVFAVQHGIVDH